MKSRDFVFWLNGFFEIGGEVQTIDARQVAIIKQHLGLVFMHDPEMQAPAHSTVQQTPYRQPDFTAAPPLPPNAIMIC